MSHSDGSWIELMRGMVSAMPFFMLSNDLIKEFIMLNKKHILAVAVTLAATGMTAQARINASQAADAAKSHIAGKVVDVDYRQKRGQYEVDIIAADGRRHEVWVDARDGRVLDSHLDRDDDDDDRQQAPGKARQDQDDDRDDDKDDDRDDRDDKDDRDNDDDDDDDKG